MEHVSVHLEVSAAKKLFIFFATLTYISYLLKKSTVHLWYNRGVGAVEEMGGCSGDLSVAATASIRLVSYPPPT